MFNLLDNRKTPVFDWQAMDFATGIGGVVVTATGIKAAAQTVMKAQLTQLGKFSVYGDLENPSKNHIYGSRVHDVAVRSDIPRAVRLSEMEREAKETAAADSWVKSVPYAKAYEQKDADGVTRCYMDLRVNTAFGEIALREVDVNGG